MRKGNLELLEFPWWSRLLAWWWLPSILPAYLKIRYYVCLKYHRDGEQTQHVVTEVVRLPTVLPAPAAAVVPAAGRHRPPCTCPSSPASQTSAPPSRPGDSEEKRIILHQSQTQGTSQGASLTVAQSADNIMCSKVGNDGNPGVNIAFITFVINVRQSSSSLWNKSSCSDSDQHNPSHQSLLSLIFLFIILIS